MKLLVIIGLIGITGCAGDVADRPPGVDKYTAGVAAFKAGDRDGAILALQQALAANPNLRMAHTLLGEVYRSNGDYAHAAEQYEVVERLDKYSWNNHYNLGVAYQFLHRLEDAAAAYLRALKLEPKDVRTNMNLGLVYLALGQNDDALKYLQTATELDPKMSDAWSNYGVALDAAGKSSEAESAYRNALERDTGSISALQNLAVNLTAQKRAGEAITVCQQLLLRLDTPLTRKLYADALALSGQYVPSLVQYDISLKRDPKYFPAMSNKGFLLIKQYKAGGELDEDMHTSALKLWRESLALNPDQPKVQAALEEWSK
jgi:tetratricopeptide (TPR) repeat protein